MMDVNFLSSFTSQILEDDSQRTKKKGRANAIKTTTYNCKYCTKQFTENQLLMIHQKKHDLNKPFQCSICGFSCRLKKYLARHHRQVHSGPGDYECDICNKRFQYPNKLTKHMLVHTGEKPYSCKVCKKCFNSTYSLKTHMYIHTDEKPYQCDICEYACRDSSSLRKHKQSHEPARVAYSCTICDNRLKSQLKMHVAEKHLQIDVRRHECERCDMRFKSKGAMNVHIRNVHDRKTPPCICPVCGKSSSSKSNLKEHMIRHSGAKMYVCNYKNCDKSYVDSSGLKKHLAKHHGGKAKKFEIKKKDTEVECDYCALRLDNKNNLIRHMKKYHKRGKNKYKCRVCDYQTNDKTRFRRHLYNKHEMTIYHCVECEQNFRKLRTYNDHNEIIHGGKQISKNVPELVVQVKQEPVDFEDMDITSVDLYEVEKHKVLEDLIRQTTEDSQDMQQSDELTDKQTEELTNLQTPKQEDLSDINLDQYCQKTVMDTEKVLRKKQTRFRAHIDKKAKENNNKYVTEVVKKIRREQHVKELKRIREEYNKRIMSSSGKTENIKVKYYKSKKTETSDKNVSSQVEDKSDETQSRDENENDEKKSPTHHEDKDDEKNLPLTNEEVKGDETQACDENKRDEESSFQSDGEERKDESDASDEDYVSEEVKKTKTGLKWKTQQCYICFKLYPTKAELLEHCKEHFDICHTKPIKKCPLCEFATKHNLSRHMKLVHNVEIKIPYHHLKDNNKNGCRYYYEVNSGGIDKIELIPSVRNLNMIAYRNIDAKNRKINDNTVKKTKLVKKGKEWVVEKESVVVNEDFLIPDINFDEVTMDFDTEKMSKNEMYMAYLRKLFQISKKMGVKIMFPCSECEKICQHLCALKLHFRKHDKNAKPFKPKVYKFKVKINKGLGKNKGKRKVIRNGRNKAKGNKNKESKDETKEDNEARLESRKEIPNAIKNKHKCDPKLMEFYTKNIRGKNIEFWQFLKIFNKMGRDKIDDFKDLGNLNAFGVNIDDNDDDELNENDSAKEDINNINDTVVTNNDNKTCNDKNVNRIGFNDKNINKTHINDKNANVFGTKNVNERNLANNKFKRVIRISRLDHLKRNAIKNKLRQEIANRNSPTKFHF